MKACGPALLEDLALERLWVVYPGRNFDLQRQGGRKRRSAILGSAASRGAKMVEDAADDAAFGSEGDDPHHVLAPGTDERIDLVHVS